jgi:hypothetical protein
MCTTMFIRRGLVLALAISGIPLFSSAAAAAAPPAYAGSGVSIKAGGGSVTPLTQCLEDARDNVISSRRAACRQAATAGSTLRLTNASIWVFRHDSGRAPVFSRSRATIVISGHVAIAINQRVNDAQDGVINNQSNSCDQVASAGNLLQLTDVTITVAS